MTKPRIKIPGQIYLWLAVLIFGASSAITRKLTEICGESLRLNIDDFHLWATVE
jgi:hypothetical protein